MKWTSRCWRVRAARTVAILVARPLDEDLLDQPDALPVAGQGAALDDDAQAGEALGGDVGGDEAVGHRRRLRAGARARR